MTTLQHQAIYLTSLSDLLPQGDIIKKTCSPQLFHMYSPC